MSASTKAFVLTILYKIPYSGYFFLGGGGGGDLCMAKPLSDLSMTSMSYIVHWAE